MKKLLLIPDESETFGEFFRRYHSKNLSNIGPKDKMFGCAACDRGDYTIGHAYTCPKSDEYVADPFPWRYTLSEVVPFGVPSGQFGNIRLTGQVVLPDTYIGFGKSWDGATWVSTQSDDPDECARADAHCLAMEKLIDAAPYYWSDDGMETQLADFSLTRYTTDSGWSYCLAANSLIHMREYMYWRQWNLYVGPESECPAGFTRKESYRNMVGMSGRIRLILQGHWWEWLPPEKLQMVLVNWSCNPVYPTIEVLP